MAVTRSGNAGNAVPQGLLQSLVWLVQQEERAMRRHFYDLARDLHDEREALEGTLAAGQFAEVK